MEVDGINLAIGGTAVTALAGLAGAWIKARYGRKVDVGRMPPVEMAEKYVTCEQCKAHRERIERRVDAQFEMFAKVSDKLDLIEAHNEDRAKRMHDRLDPVIRSAAETSAVLRNHLEDHRSAKK